MTRPTRIAARLLATAAIGLATTAAMPALAQDLSAAAQDAPADAAPEAAGGITDIVVTARKRSERVQDIPVSITAISGEQIANYDLSSLEKVASMTPNFTIARASNGSGAQLSLRGIGSSFTSIGIEQSVASVVDGVYYGQGRVINEGLFDLEQIEILKGPQSLFFGKNSTAGVVSVTTADPTARPEFIARLGYEFRSQEATGEFIASGPISDTLGIRVALRGTKMWDGYFRNVAGPVTYATTDVATGDSLAYTAAPAQSSGPREKSFLGRVTLKWEPTSAFTATIKASLNIDRVGNPAWNYVLYSCPSGTVIASPLQPCGRDFRNAMNNVPAEIAAVMPLARDDGALYNDYDSHGITTALNYALDAVTITSVTNYNRNVNKFSLDADYLSSSTTNVWANEKDSFRAFSGELRALTTFDGPVNLLAGVYYQNTKLRARQWTVLGGLQDSTVDPALRFLGFTKDSGTRDETIAGYGQLIWKIVPQVELTGGVRYTHETKRSYFGQPYVNAALSGVFVPDDPFTTSQTFDNWSPEATITWKPLETLTTYLAYKTGYKSGGFSNTGIQSAFGSPSDFDFDPERVRGFEAGIRGTLAGRQLRYSLGAYHYKFSDLQVDFFNSTTVSFITTNAGGAKISGVEFELEYAPRALAGLTLRGTLNYNDAKYSNYLAPCYGGQSIADGCTLTVNGLPYQDLTGRPTANAPHWMGSFGVAYDLPVADDWVVGMTADARYSDAYLASAFANTTARQPSYVNLDASLRLRTADDRYEIALIGRNLTNRFVLTGSLDVVGTGGGTGTAGAVRSDQAGLVALPRTIQLQGTVRF